MPIRCLHTKTDSSPVSYTVGFSAPITVCPLSEKICAQTAKNTGTVSHSSVCLSKSLILSSLCASRLRLLTALYAWALIMLTLAKLGKHTRLCAGSFKSSQCAVERLVFLYADFRHCFPSLRALPINADAPAKCREYIISPQQGTVKQLFRIYSKNLAGIPYLTTRLMILFGTTIDLTTFLSAIALCTLESAIAIFSASSLGQSNGRMTLLLTLPLICTAI